MEINLENQTHFKSTQIRVGIFKDKLTFLDCALTNKTYSRVLHNYHNSPAKMKDPINWIESQDMYYLSDGGYSRILCKWDGENWQSIRIYLASESRKETKEAWPRCKELVADVEAALQIAARIAFEL